MVTEVALESKLPGTKPLDALCWAPLLLTTGEVEAQASVSAVMHSGNTAEAGLNLALAFPPSWCPLCKQELGMGQGHLRDCL